MIKGCKHIVFFLLIAQVAYAQNYINYNENNGLPSNHIYRITQDAKGFIWVGTDKGLVKYNGNKFTVFTTANGLQSNAVWNMFPTPDGKLWFVSKTTKIGYIENDSIHTFPSNVKNEVFNPIFTGVVGNNVFPNGPHKSFTFDSKNKHWKRLKNVVNKKNHVVGTLIKHKKWDIIYHPSNRKNISLIDKDTKDTVSLKMNSHFGTFFTRNQLTDSLFILLNRKKYAVINLNTQKIYERKFEDEVGIEFSRNICVNYVNDEIQISGNGFVGKLNKNYKLTDLSYIDESLNTNNTFIDKQGTLWIASFSNGVYKLPNNEQHINHSFQNHEVSKLRKVNNSLVALVQKKGFYKYNEKKSQFRPYLKNNSYLYNSVFIPHLQSSYYLSVKKSEVINSQEIIKRLKYSKGISDSPRSMVYWNRFFYTHTSFGVHKIKIVKDSLQLIRTYQQIGTNHITVFNNRLIVATNNGLKEITNDSLVAKIGYIEKVKHLLTLPNNKLLMTTDGYGAFITDLSSTSQISGTEHLIVSDAYNDENTLWLATNKGVQEYRREKDSYKLFRKIDKRYGLPTEKINSVITNKNKIFIATNLGIVDLLIKDISKLKLIDTYIKSISFNNKKLKNNSSITYQKDNTVEIELGVIDFSEDTNPVQYSYKLEPLHNEWHTTTSSKLNFNDLPPNNYLLTVKVNDIEKTRAFIIKPQWYQTWVFYLLLLSFFVTSIIFATAYISRLIQKRKTQKLLQLKKMSELELKALRSQMNPHFVFNSLTAIQYYINQNNFVSSDRYLVKFSRLIRDFFELSKEQTISIEREKLLLKNYLDLEQMRFKGKLSYQINIDSKLDSKAEIPTMLLQPVVENAINHGIFNKENDGFVNLSFEKINDATISISISDDGVGIERTKKDEKRFKSTSVLTERIQFLNDTKKWNIQVKRKNLYEDREDKGHIVTFIIIKLL